MKTKRFLALVLAFVFAVGGFYFPTEAESTVTVSAADSEFYMPSRCPYTLDGSYLKGVEVNTTVAELAYYYGTTAITVKSKSGAALSSAEKLTTGCTVTVNGVTVTVVVTGDTTGDGATDNNDVEIAKAILVNARSSSALEALAAELTGDGIMSSADYLTIKHLEACQLLVQSAPSTASVPNLSGMTEREAEQALQSAGFVADVRYVSEGTPGQVVYQKTSAGTKAGEGAKITVVVTAPAKYMPLNYDRMKGVWLFQYYTSGGMFKSGTSQRSESSYRQYVQTVVDNMVKDGFNTVLLQMRPNGDSLYPSQYFSPSPYAVSGTGYGSTNSAFAYDPLEVFLEIAHEKDISVHAWLNPMRLMSSSQLSAVNSQFTLKQWYNDSSKNGTYIVNVSGKYYLNPAYPEARQLIIDGVMEICENYDIDGIHFDDYFYVSIDSESTDLAFDQAAFNLYGSSYGSASSLSVRKEFRRQQVNTLLRDIYSAMHEYNDDLIFGISPAGNIDNNQTGYLCADVKTWCSTPGYVDYICPQVYWSFDYSWNPAKFDVCTENWAAMCTTDEVDLIIGIPTYRAENNASYSETDPGWYNRKDNIARMLTYLKNHDRASGWVFFKYESTYNINTTVGSYASAFSQEIANYIGMVKDW